PQRRDVRGEDERRVLEPRAVHAAVVLGVHEAGAMAEGPAEVLGLRRCRELARGADDVHLFGGQIRVLVGRALRVALVDRVAPVLARDEQTRRWMDRERHRVAQALADDAKLIDDRRVLRVEVAQVVPANAGTPLTPMLEGFFVERADLVWPKRVE